VRASAVGALHAVLKLFKANSDDSVTRLLSRITRGKSQAGIIADSSYAVHVSKVIERRCVCMALFHVILCVLIYTRITIYQAQMCSC